MLRRLGVILLAASILHLWGIVLLVGPDIADPLSDVPPLERVTRVFVLSLTGGGFQMMAGWYLWRRGEAAIADAVPFGGLLLVRHIGIAFLIATTIVEVAAAGAVIAQQWVVVGAMSVVSLPVLSFGFLLFWMGVRLPPPATKPKEKARPAQRISEATRRRR